MDIKFKVKPEWLEKEDFIEELAKLLAGIIDGPEPRGPFRDLLRDDNRRWQIDVGNNWWLRQSLEDPSEFIVTYRYGNSHLHMLDGLRLFLIWRLGIQEYNKED